MKEKNNTPPKRGRSKSHNLVTDSKKTSISPFDRKVRSISVISQDEEMRLLLRIAKALICESFSCVNASVLSEGNEPKI